MTDALERAARAIAQTQIPAYAQDKIWAEDVDMWRRRLARSDIGGIDNPFATARAAILAFLDDEALVASTAELIRHHFDASSRHVGEHRETVKDVLIALRQAAQGEP